MKLLSPRYVYLFGFIVIALLLVTSVYLEKHDGMMPCALCLLQRYTLAVTGVLFLFGALFSLKRVGKLILSCLAFVFSLMGAFLAGRQVWLQHLPNSNGECGASIQYMMKVLPLKDVMAKVISGSAECSEVTWRFFYLSLAEWSLLVFGVLVIVCIWQIKKA